MSWLFESGHAADVVLGVLLVEAFWLRAKGWSVRGILGLLGPAALIVGGLRGALVGAPWPLIALPLALSLPLHLLDLRHRMTGSGLEGRGRGT